MDAVVIWNIFEVVVLQGPEEVQEYFSGDFEGLDQVPFLRYNKYMIRSCSCILPHMIRSSFGNM
jgi:hypothetical protein